MRLRHRATSRAASRLQGRRSRWSSAVLEASFRVPPRIGTPGLPHRLGARQVPGRRDRQPEQEEDDENPAAPSRRAPHGSAGLVHFHSASVPPPPHTRIDRREEGVDEPPASPAAKGRGSDRPCMPTILNKNTPREKSGSAERAASCEASGGSGTMEEPVPPAIVSSLTRGSGGRQPSPNRQRHGPSAPDAPIGRGVLMVGAAGTKAGDALVPDPLGAAISRRLRRPSRCRPGSRSRTRGCS